MRIGICRRVGRRPSSQDSGHSHGRTNDTAGDAGTEGVPGATSINGANGSIATSDIENLGSDNTGSQTSLPFTMK
jgi:hypothetical protein